MTADPHHHRSLRDAFGRFATGVTVVTCISPDGRPVGVTVNSFASVSLDPPLLLWSLMRRSANLAAFLDAGGFAVNVLGDDQRDLAARFAAPVQDRFAGVPWTPGLDGAPLLSGCVASFECSVFRTIEAGDHVVFLGRVHRFEGRAGTPLLFFAGRYAELRGEPAAAPAVAPVA